MITYTQEKVRDILDDLKVLHKEQWNETEGYRGLEFNPNYPRYVEYSDSGFYRVFTVRDEGKLIGHLSVYVSVSMHTQTFVVTEDTLFLTKASRGGRTALRLFQFAEEILASEGVREMFCSVKNGASSRRLLEYLGCQHVSDGYHKLLKG